MALTSLYLENCEGITAGGLAFLNEAPLKDFKLRGCSQISEKGLCSFLSGKPLTFLDLTRCGQDAVTQGILPTLRGLPLVNLSVDGKYITEEDINELIQAVPSIKHVHLDRV